MTLVANFLVEQYPILFGDLMLSCDANGQKPSFPLPLHNDPNSEIRNRFIAGLKQKVIVLSPRLAVAWAGDYLNACKAMELLKDVYVPQGIYDTEHLAKFLTDVGIKDLYMTFIMVMNLDDNKAEISQFSWPENRWLKSNKFGDCHIGGTGKNDLVQLMQITEQATIKMSTEPTKSGYAISIAASLITNFSGEQMRAGKGLDTFYGGGFEIVTLIGNELKKVNDIAYHLWEAHIGPNNEVKVIPHSIIKYNYVGDTLLIRTLDYAMPPEPPDEKLFAIIVSSPL